MASLPNTKRWLLDKIDQLKASNDDKNLPLEYEHILWILRNSRMALMNDKMLVNVNPAVHICGDIHGQFSDLLCVFNKLGNPSRQNKYLFLGDYVDRGRQSMEVMLILLCYKIIDCDSIYILRGNHESAEISRQYGFYDECKRRSQNKGRNVMALWKTFVDVFNCMPVAATIGEKGHSPLMLCMHGGISPELKNYNQINTIRRPIEIPEEGLLCDLLWSDPNTEGAIGDRGWLENDRGVSHVFCADALATFLKDNNLDLLCRAHQVVEDGYEFWANRKLVTIFSAPNYCGEFDNKGGVMTVMKNMVCTFSIFS